MIGDTVANYELLSLLGSTRSADLYLGNGSDGRCTVKLVRQELCADRGRVDRAMAIALAAGALAHRGIEHVFDAGWHEHRAYLLGDVVPSASAAELVKRRVFEPDSARTIIRLAADALAAAHEAGIRHRALDTVVLYVGYAADRIQLHDFGLAELAGEAVDDVQALGRIARELLGAAPGFDQLIARMTADDPATRPTMVEVRDELAGQPKPAASIPRVPARDVASVMDAIALDANDEVTPPPGPPPTD